MSLTKKKLNQLKEEYNSGKIAQVDYESQKNEIENALQENKLASCLRMAAYALEYDVGKQGYGRGINNSQPFHPFLCAVTAAVRRKFVLVRLVKVTVNVLEELLRASGVGIGQSAAPGHLFNAYVMEFAYLCRHRCLNLAQGVEAHDDGIQHREQMSEPVETLHVLLTAVFAAHFNSFITVE